MQCGGMHPHCIFQVRYHESGYNMYPLFSVSKKSLKLDVIANQPAMNYGMIATGNHSHF